MPPPFRLPQPCPLELRHTRERGTEMKSSTPRQWKNLQLVLDGVFLGGAALQRCGNSIILNAASAAEVAHSMRRWLQAAALAVAVILFMGAGDDSARFKDLGHRMMCTCGCGQVLLECNHVGCQSSDKMRDQLQAALDKGN